MSQENRTNELNQNAKGAEHLRATSQLIAHSRAELGRVIAGQGRVIEEVLIAVLCQGHALLEGVPGIAKTLIVKALGRLLGLGFQRVQATPDLMPADILGTTILRAGSKAGSETSPSTPARSSPICCWWTRSTACRRAPRPRCSNAWKSGR